MGKRSDKTWDWSQSSWSNHNNDTETNYTSEDVSNFFTALNAMFQGYFNNGNSSDADTGSVVEANPSPVEDTTEDAPATEVPVEPVAVEEPVINEEVPIVIEEEEFVFTDSGSDGIITETEGLLMDLPQIEQPEEESTQREAIVEEDAPVVDDGPVFISPPEETAFFEV